MLQTDVWVTLGILTCATVPFYVLGAGVLRALDLQPRGLQTIAMLSEMYTRTLGPWAMWLFGIGAVAILFSTTLSGVAAGGRFLPDYIMELGYLERHNLVARKKIIRGYCALVPILALIFYLYLRNPVLLVTIGAMGLALLLPIQSAAVLWLHKHRLDHRVCPGRFVHMSIWAIFLFELAMAALVIWFVVLRPIF